MFPFPADKLILREKPADEPILLKTKSRGRRRRDKQEREQRALLSYTGRPVDDESSTKKLRSSQDNDGPALRLT